jgi:transposase
VEHRPPGHGPLPAAPPRPARARVTELTTALRKCPISELARFGRTLHTWRDEPAAHFDHPAVSNGPTENLNLKIKDTKRIAPATATSTTTGLRLLLNHARIQEDHSPTRIRTRAPGSLRRAR